MRIIKSHGGQEDFSKRKLFTSLKRSGLSKHQSQIIADKISHEIAEGSKTRDIYKKALHLVKEKSPVAAVQYSLKRALFELGPSGHHFESFVARYFEELGFTTETCRTLQGQYVKHEVDVVAKKNNQKSFVECKFHNHAGIKNDIKITLYVKARWDDLKNGPQGKNLEDFYLASNTAFTLDAVTYAKGTGLKLLGINAPAEKSFIDEIKEKKLYPVTSLKRINKFIKNELLRQDIILVKEIKKNGPYLRRLGMSSYQIENLMDEISILLGE